MASTLVRQGKIEQVENLSERLPVKCGEIESSDWGAQLTTEGAADSKIDPNLRSGIVIKIETCGPSRLTHGPGYVILNYGSGQVLLDPADDLPGTLRKRMSGLVSRKLTSRVKPKRPEQNVRRFLGEARRGDSLIGRNSTSLSPDEGSRYRGVAERETVDALIEQVCRAQDPGYLAAVLDRMRECLETPGACDKLVVCVRNETLSPKARWAFLELLTEAGDRRVAQLALAGLAQGAYSEFSIGCLIALRLVPDVGLADDVHEVVLAMIKGLETFLARRVELSVVNARLLKEAVLTLGRFTRPEDVPLLTRLLEEDVQNTCVEQVLVVLTRMASSFAVPDADWKALVRTCRQLLVGWAHPRVVCDLDAFSKASQVIEVLSAPLEPDGLKAALEAVRSSGSSSLGRRMNQHILRARASRGEPAWRGQQLVAEVEDSLRQLWDSAAE